MRVAFRAISVALIAAVLVFSTAGCGGGGGGGNPKSLAKQSYDAMQELAKLQDAGVPKDDPRITKLKEKIKGLSETVSALSAEDQKIVKEETNRLWGVTK